jgi:exonuclease SbcC
MLITRLELENIKSYRQFNVDFRKGTTAISGANGAGKTTLVEAIGFALFDFLPYSNRNLFVREGEKHGKVVVHLIGGDDRPYVVERRCGAGSYWMVYDQEADLRVEQRADVIDKLHEIFGIDRERPLDDLFRDALGVPQGTFTSIFLETAAKRKQTFDALLQIEDFKTAFDYLLDVRKEYDQQIQAQKDEIQRLEIETRDLDSWRAALQTFRREDAAKKEQNARSTQLLVEYKERATILEQLRVERERCREQLRHQRTIHNGAQDKLWDSENALNLAREAHRLVEESLSDYQRYQQAEAQLTVLRKDERQRNKLKEQQSSLEKECATLQANIRNLHGRLDEVARAQQRILELLPLVERQHQLERECDLQQQRLSEFNRQLREIERLQKQQAGFAHQLETTRQQIAGIEPLRPLAEKLSERLEEVTRLDQRMQERTSKQLQFEERRRQLQEKIEERGRLADNLKKAEAFITRLEALRPEAVELPQLETQWEELNAQKHRLEGNIEGYKRSRKLSAGGQCPLLKEQCLNIQRRGISSLESFFDSEIARDEAELVVLVGQVELLGKRKTLAKRANDELQKMGEYVERRDNIADRLKQAAQEITRLEREVYQLKEDLDTLAYIEGQVVQAKAALEESRRAEKQVRELDVLSARVQQLETQIQQAESELEERKRLVEELQDSVSLLEQARQELKRLNDPRGESRGLQEMLKNGPILQNNLLAEQGKLTDIEQRLQTLAQELAQYADLDTRIGEQEALKRVSAAGYNTYVQNEKEAKRLSEREQAYQEALSKAQQAEQDLLAAEAAYSEAEAAFDEQEYQIIQGQIRELDFQLVELAKDMSNLQEKINEFEQKIAHAEALRLELEKAEQEKQTLEDLNRMLEQFRKLIKEAAPFVLKAMLSDISAEANRIFGEIMGDRSAQLSWENDYEIQLRRQGVTRTFAQLSGGEQMSAALAVRLALLKKLSTLNIAFFDEPTQNMDELRRTNLAEQIRRVRGFDQLIVISHDDTFEQSLDSLVRLRKKDGETRVMSEEEVVYSGEQVSVHAS